MSACNSFDPDPKDPEFCDVCGHPPSDHYCRTCGQTGWHWDGCDGVAS